MLDLTGIMFSSIMMMMVIFRAVQMDRSQPWFQAVKRKDDTAAKEQGAWRRQK